MFLLCKQWTNGGSFRARSSVSCLLSSLAFDFDAHAAGSACDHVHGSFFVVGVEVFHLGPRDLAHLCGCDASHLALFGAPEPVATPAAFFSRSAAGGVLVTNVNERSS